MPWAILLRGLAATAVVLALVAARLTYLSAGQWSAAEARLRAGDESGAVAHLGRSLRAQFPGDPWSARSQGRLVALAAGAEARGDRRLALDAWTELRAALAASRSVYQPSAAVLRLADCHLARLTGRAPELCDEAASRPAGPSSLPWTLVALAGLILWPSSAWLWAARAIDREDRLRLGPALLWGVGILVGVGMFALGLLRA